MTIKGLSLIPNDMETVYRLISVNELGEGAGLMTNFLSGDTSPPPFVQDVSLREKNQAVWFCTMKGTRIQKEAFFCVSMSMNRTFWFLQ